MWTDRLETRWTALWAAAVAAGGDATDPAGMRAQFDATLAAEPPKDVDLRLALGVL